MRIAVIGGGISGMMSWYLLRQQHQVTLFEAGNYLGGHTATVDVSVNGREYAVDTGFIVFNNWTYPLFNRFIAELQVPFQHTTMSFAVTDRAADFEYNGNNLWSLFSQKRNLLRPFFWRMLRDIVRFNKIAKQAVADNSADLDLPIDAFLQKHQLGNDMRDKYLLPMGAAIWSAGLIAMPDFPLRFFLQFCNNHGLLNINDRPQWAVIKGGSRQYVNAMLAKCGTDGIRLNSPVAQVRRFDESVEIALADGSTEHFDQVVFACHSDQALKMLADATATERQVLGGIAYQDNDVVLHTDIRLLPKRKAAWAAWNYLLGADAATRATLSYNMNMLQGISSDTTFVVSLNASNQIAAEHVLRRFTYAHPVYNQSTMQSQARRSEINGQNRSYFCGAYWYNGFHEDGVRSAVDVAAMLGVKF
ncbi:FAD-dependent oxidoreductase [Rheinheimera texasensis]|uniref:NAD(P)/FAD-dependent oxidoreductase n=1 Tax=Rheinheimera texasensis TaxID=306205 RepID=UPI0032B28381